MTDQDKSLSAGFTNVIDSVEKASDAELLALARIERKLTGPVSGPKSAPVAPSNAATSAPRSVQMAQERKKQQDSARKKAIKGQESNENLSAKPPTNNRNLSAKSKVGNKTDISRENNGDLTVNITVDNPSVKKLSNVGNSSDKLQSDGGDLSDKKKARAEALKQLRSPNRPAGKGYIDTNGRARDENGKFTSRDKAEQNKKESAERGGKEDESEDRKRDALLTRIGKMLSDADDPMDADSTNAAGVAAGGSFWKAGHEAYTMTKNTIGGGVSGVKKMSEFLGGDKDEEAKKPGLMRRMFTRGKSGGAGKRNSASVIAAAAQKEQAKATEQQTEAIKEGDAQIVEKLDELLKEKGGKKSGGLLGMLGAAAMGKFGKKLLASILGGLGAKTLADKLRGGGGKRNKRRPMLGDDCGCDTDMPGGNSRDKKRKPSRKERRKRIREAGKDSLLKRKRRISRVPSAGGGAVALAEEALDDVDLPAKKTKAPNTKAPATKATEKAVEKTATKVAAHEVETAAAVAGTGAAAAGAKVAASKAGENAAAKAATTTAEGVATKSAETGAKAVAAGTESAGTKVAVKGTEAAGEKVAVKAVEKTGAKVATKVALGASLRAIPVVGQAIGAGIDGVMGWRDKEGQQSAFGLKDDQEATKRQKAEYSAANVLDMGGLVSGGAGLLARGAKALGMDSVADKLTFSTEDIAKGIDNKVTSGKNAVKSATDFLGITKPDKAKEEKADDARTQTLVSAIQDGAKSTVEAITGLIGNGVNMVKGAAEDVSGATSRVVAGFTQPTTDDVSNDLNIGGANAKNRNFRNNNFGNLNYVGQEGARLENANANGERRFARFDTPEEGIRALGNQLMSYSNGTSKAAGYKKLNTVDEIISKYAPETENNTKAYKASLAKQLGVGVSDQINMKDPQVMTKMVRAISTIEGGNPQVTDKFISTALGQYQGGDTGKGKWVGQYNDSTLDVINKKRAEQGQDALTKDAQFSGIATANGKSVDAVKAADVTPVTPVTAPKAGATTTENGVNYRAAQLPLGIGQNTEIGQKLANAEGLRHQTGAAGGPDPVQHAQSTKKHADPAPANTYAQMQKNLDALNDQASTAPAAVKPGSTSSAPATAVSRATAPSEGVQFRSAELPLQGTAMGKWMLDNKVGDTLKNAEGLRHQVTPGSATKAASTRPNMAIPAKIPTVTDMAANNVQPTVHVSNEQSFPKEVKATFEKISKILERIEGHTKDTAEKSGDASPKANTPQPAPRGSTPLSINDPLMASVAND